MPGAAEAHGAPSGEKGAYHAVRGHYEELGIWFGALAGLLLPVIVPGLWYVGLALAIVGGVIGQRIGVKKGRALDDIYREVAWELKHEAEAEAPARPPPTR